MFNSQDPKFVSEGLKFWQEQVAKHPRNKKAQWNLEQFEKWAKELRVTNA